MMNAVYMNGTFPGGSKGILGKQAIMFQTFLSNSAYHIDMKVSMIFLER
jgi:hypothetical protein